MCSVSATRLSTAGFGGSGGIGIENSSSSGADQISSKSDGVNMIMGKSDTVIAGGSLVIATIADGAG
jgi:hypothetical protein